MAPAVVRNLFGGRVEVVGAGAALRPWPGTAARHADDREAAHGDGAEQAPRDRPRRRDQQEQADDVGEEAGGEQEGAADHDQDTVGPPLAGGAPFGGSLVETPPGAAALVARQNGARQGAGEQP